MKKKVSRPKAEPLAGFYSRVGAIYPLLLMVIFLLVPLSYHVVVRARYVMFLVVCGGFVLLIGGLKADLALIRGTRLHRPNAVEIAILAYLLLTAISALASPYTGTILGNTRRDGLLTIAIYGLSALLLMRIFRPKAWMITALAVVLCLNCLLILPQLCGFDPLGQYPEGMNFYDADNRYPGHFIGTIGNTDLFSAFYAMALGVLMTAVIRGKTRQSLLWLLPICLISFCLFAVGVDEGILAVLAGMVLMLPLVVHSGSMLARALLADGTLALSLSLSTIIRFDDHSLQLHFSGLSALMLAGAVVLGLAGLFCHFRRIRPKHLRRWLCILVVALLICSIVFLFFYDSGSGTLHEAHEMLHGNFDDSFGSGRIFIWRQVLEKIWERPLLGAGPDTLAQQELESFTRYIEELQREIHVGLDVAHNEYLNIAVNQGILALVAYLSILILTLIRWWKHPENDTIAICCCGILFYCIAAFFGISMFLTTPFLWLLIAGANLRHTA